MKTIFNKRIALTKHAKERLRDRILWDNELILKDASDKELYNFVLKLLSFRKVRKQKIEYNEKGQKIRKIWCQGAYYIVARETEHKILILTVVNAIPDDQKRLIGSDNKNNFYTSERVW